MTTDLVGVLAGMSSSAQRGMKLQDAVVTGIGDGGVNITFQGQPIIGAAVCDGYSRRARAGDIVACLVIGTRWLVLDKIGVSADAPPVGSVDISYSDTDPSGSGWQANASGDVFFRVDGDGAQKLHLKRATPLEGQPPNSDPKNPTGSQWFDPSATQTYAAGDVNGYFNGQPAQGSWSGPPNVGVWFFGSQLSDYCAGMNLVGMSFTLGRADDGSGVYGPSTVHMYLIKEETPPFLTPSLYMGWTVGQKFSPGDTATRSDPLTIPADQAAGLAFGPYRGIAAYTTLHRDYMVFKNGYGDIRATVS